MSPSLFWICAAICREIQATATGSAMTRLTEAALIPACSAMSLMDPTLLSRASATLISAVPGTNAWTSRSSIAVALFHASTSGGVHVRTLGRSFSRLGGGDLRADVTLGDVSVVEPEIEGSVERRGERKDEDSFDTDPLAVSLDRRPDQAVEVLRRLGRNVQPVPDIGDSPVLVQPTEDVDGLADVQGLTAQVEEEVDAFLDLTFVELSFGAKRRWLGKGCYLGPG
jgi:hypothetical protein